MKNSLFLFLSLFFHLYSYGQNNDDISVRIAKFRDDKFAAISYTFDDGLVEHYTLVAPYFDKLGFKGTFFINGSRINEDENSIIDTTRMTWTQLKEMSDKEHEIANHGWAHKNFGRHTLDEIKEDVLKNDSAILKHIGKPALTFCYPNNTKTPEGLEFVSKNRVGARTFQRSIGGKATPENLEDWVNSLIEKNEWGVGMTHGITYGYDAFKDPQIFWEHLDKVKTQEDKIWIGTFEEVAAYMREQKNTTLEVIKKKNKWIVTPKSELDKDLFSEPLTMVVEKEGIENPVVVQAGKELKTKIEGNKMLFDFNPSGGAIEIVIENANKKTFERLRNL